MEDKTAHQEGGKGTSKRMCMCACVRVRAWVGGWIIIPSVVKQLPSLCRKILSSANLHHLETLTHTLSRVARLPPPASLRKVANLWSSHSLLPKLFQRSCDPSRSPVNIDFLWPRPSWIWWPTGPQRWVNHRWDAHADVMQTVADANWCWRLMAALFP